MDIILKNKVSKLSRTIHTNYSLTVRNTAGNSTSTASSWTSRLNTAFRVCFKNLFNTNIEKVYICFACGLKTSNDSTSVLLKARCRINNTTYESDEYSTNSTDPVWFYPVIEISKTDLVNDNFWVEIQLKSNGVDTATGYLDFVYLRTV